MPPGSYRLQLGDLLEIRHFYTPELNVVVPIRPDGRISLDLVGEVDAAGRTPSELQAELAQRYSASLRKPEVAVIVKEFGGAKVYVAGEVVNPGVVRNPGNLTLVQSIFQAGGFKKSAELKSVVVLRNQGTPEPLFMTVDVKARLQKGSSTPDLVLQANDLVFVPNTRIARMNDFVDQYIRQMIPIGISWVIGGTFVWEP